jgi:broad specificity phosphatase PhoE
MSGDFVLIRHGESTWNAAGLWQGHGDAPLSERGRCQARSLARELAEEAPTRLLASDLSRARETAEIVGRELGLVVELEPGFRELDVGAWSGLNASEVRRRWPEELARFRAGDPELRAGGAESCSQLRVRALAAFESWALRSSGCAAVVTHGGLVRTLLGVDLGNAEWRRAALAELRGGPVAGL